jgi:UDP-N-acetylglucosamine 1-carboxyvinyltransferase
MQTLRISPAPLNGVVEVSGAKNSALKLLVATLLSAEPIHLTNHPNGLLDIQVQANMLTAVGKETVMGENTITVTEPQSINTTLEWEPEKSIRNTLLMLGAMVSRFGSARVPYPGGCKLGERKWDIHEQLLTQMGANIWTEGNIICAEAPNGLRGAEIHLPFRSTGATDNAILAAVLAKGTTTVWNPHVRPECLRLIRLLQKMGAQIEVHYQEKVVIHGVEKLGSATEESLADNVEALTWLVGAVITGGDLEILNFPYEDLEVPLIFFRDSGAKWFSRSDSMIVRGGRPHPVDICTGPYPGINSDMQPLFGAFGAFANGETRIIDLRFHGRYGYAEEFAKMGIQSKVEDGYLKIDGGHPVHGAEVRAIDLRAGAALMLAACAAKGETLIHDAWMITRGYENVEAKLRALGVSAEAA